MFTADKIDDRGLWLGDLKAAENDQALDENQITAVLAVIDIEPPFKSPNRKYLHIYAEDLTSTDLISHEFEKAFQFIEKSIEEEHRQVLVFCQAGRSRSATIVTMYLMRKYSLRPEEAIEKLQSKRKHTQVNPNESFIKQLDLYYRMNYKVDQENPMYKEFLKNRFQPLLQKFNDQSPIVFLNNNENYEYRCRSCDENLFQSHDIQYHQDKGNEICHNSTRIFTYFIDWIDDVFVQPVGSIKCRKCRSILGEYSLEGLRCSCTQWIKPAFYFQCQTIK